MSEGEGAKKGRRKKGTRDDGTPREPVRLTITGRHSVYPAVPLDVATGPPAAPDDIPAATLAALEARRADTERSLTKARADWGAIRIDVGMPPYDPGDGAGLRRRVGNWPGTGTKGAPDTLPACPSGAYFGQVWESLDGVLWANSGRFAYYPAAPIPAEEAAALGKRLQDGVEAAALAALEAFASDEAHAADDASAHAESAPPSVRAAAAAVRAYLVGELAPGLGESCGDDSTDATLGEFAYPYATSLALVFLEGKAAAIEAELALEKVREKIARVQDLQAMYAAGQVPDPAALEAVLSDYVRDVFGLSDPEEVRAKVEEVRASLAEAEPKRRGRSVLPAFTAPPVVALEQAVADLAAEGARLRAADEAGREPAPGVSGGSSFALVDGNRRLVHTRGKAGYMVAVDYADPVGSIEDVLREVGEFAGLEGVFAVAAGVFHSLEYAAAKAADPEAEPVPVHVEDSLLDIGWQRDRDGVRETRADAVERVARLYLRLNGWNVEGSGWGVFTDKDGRAVDASSRGPLFTTTVIDDPQGTLTGERRPVGFDHRPGDFLARAAANPRLLPVFGTYRELARMPRQRPADAWAVSIGLALVQRWRELTGHARVTRPGDDNKPVIHAQRVTRRYLLSQYPPQPDPVDVIADKTNGARNAKTYWAKALANLKARGVIDADVERRLRGDPKKLPRRGWGEAWLDERLDGRPPAGYEAEFLALAAGAQAHAAKERRRQRRGKK